jgi:hypothetical protein
VTFDDNAFAITSAISKPAAVSMYNGKLGPNTKPRSTFKTSLDKPQYSLADKDRINF